MRTQPLSDVNPDASALALADGSLCRSVSRFKLENTTYIIQIGQRYFNARGGYNGSFTSRDSATLFNLSDANDRAARMGAVVLAV